MALATHEGDLGLHAKTPAAEKSPSLSHSPTPSSSVPVGSSEVKISPGEDGGPSANELSSLWSHLENNCKCPLSADREKTRNLVVCIDGTAQQIGTHNTHVAELYSRLQYDEQQLAYYTNGIGSYVAGSSRLEKFKHHVVFGVDMAIAFDYKKNILRSYEWLSENYRQGDRIFIFGFSRGAFQARIVAEMIETVGLMRKDNTGHIASAYRWYDLMRKSTHKLANGCMGCMKTKYERKLKNATASCERLKRLLSHKHARVHFLGAWDTVSAIGLVQGSEFLLEDFAHICGCRHALGLHELRVKFGPEYMTTTSNKGAAGDVKEVWFMGTHSDIGGGNAMTDEGFGPPLQWMIHEALAYGLLVQCYPTDKWWSTPRHHISMSWWWRILEYLPIKRLSYHDNTSGRALEHWPPHRSKGRRIQSGQLIHESVSDYPTSSPIENERIAVPKAKYYDDKDKKWCHVVDDAFALGKTLQNPIERNPFLDILRTLVEKVKNTARDEKPLVDVECADSLQQIVQYPHGRQTFIDHYNNTEHRTYFLKVLRLTSLQGTSELETVVDESRERVMRALSKTIAMVFTRTEDSEIRPSMKLIDTLRYSDPEIRRQIMRTFGSRVFTGHAGKVYNVCWTKREGGSPTFISSSWDNTIRFWDANLNEQIQDQNRLRHHLGRSVAISPDGRCIAVGSVDANLKIWDPNTSNPEEKMFKSHDYFVQSIAFSADGKKIVSSSWNTVRIWDVEQLSEPVAKLRGHTDSICSVACSPLGCSPQLVASGSLDRTVRIWNMDSPQEKPKVFIGHKGDVQSVAFSSDGKRVISGSGDKTIGVWDVQSGEMVLCLEGHGGAVSAVAVSGDGTYIASGSEDTTVRLWDAKKGSEACEPLYGHTDVVSTLAFSSDHKRLVSGSYDRSLIVWGLDSDQPSSSSTKPLEGDQTSSSTKPSGGD